MKEIIDKLEDVKIKGFSLKSNIKRIRKTTDWEKILAKDVTDKDGYPKYTKNY